jgi:hypothetical protein
LLGGADALGAGGSRPVAALLPALALNPHVPALPLNPHVPALPKGFLEWITVPDINPPYPSLPPTAGALPPLPARYAADVAWVRALRRGPYPAVAKGRPAALLPRVQDPLQNGSLAALPPAPAWVSRLSPLKRRRRRA